MDEYRGVQVAWDAVSGNLFLWATPFLMVFGFRALFRRVVDMFDGKGD